MNVTSKTKSPGDLYAAAETAAAKVGVRLYNLRQSGKGIAFTLKTEGPRPKYRRFSRRLHSRSEQRTVPGRVCWHGVRDFLRALYDLVPDARVRTAMATYRDSEDFERAYPETYTKESEYMGYMMQAPIYQSCACGGRKG
jgi:hypothetical protein